MSVANNRWREIFMVAGEGGRGGVVRYIPDVGRNVAGQICSFSWTAFFSVLLS